MMLWWKYQQLRSSNLKTRLATIAELAGSKQADSVGPLLFALKDQNTEIRSAAALALGQFQDKQVIEPLIKMLRDPAPLARATAAESLGQLKDSSAMAPLIGLLRDPDSTVRVRASRSLERLGWQPENEDERKWHIVATGNLNRVDELGSDGVELLAELMRNGTPEKQLFAVKALGEIEDPRVLKLILEALKQNNVLVRIAALDILKGFANPSLFEAVEPLLKDEEPNIRAAAVVTAVSCDGSRAAPMLLGLLKDVSWEVRRETIKALGRLGDVTAIDGLSKALQDRDHDVRESAAVALGRIGDAQAIRPLVLALLDIESFVRNAAHNSLNDIDPQWEKTDAAHSVLPQIKAALKRREYWISHSAARLLGRILPDATTSDGVETPAAPPPEMILPVENPPDLSAEGFDILADLMGDRDRDLRLAAAEAFSQLREKRAAPVLATAIHDDDAFVRQAVERALIALN
jgi:HEAT repeat protein